MRTFQFVELCTFLVSFPTRVNQGPGLVSTDNDRLYLLFSHCRSYPKIFKEIWSLVSWLKMIMSETECYYYYYYYRHVICIVACARSPLPPGKIGEGNFSWWEWALYTGYLLYGNETQGLLLWFFALCSMLFTWYKTVMLYWELEVHWNET